MIDLAALPFFWLHIKKAGGTTLREFLSDVYIETDRSQPTPFIALPKEQWNDALNNYRQPLGPYDFRRCLFARDLLYGPKEFGAMYKFAVVRNPYDRIVSAYIYLTRKNRKWNAYRLIGQRRAFLEFVKRVPEKWQAPNKEQNRHIATHTAPIFSDITDNEGRVLLDDFYHLEHIEGEVEKLIEKLCLTSREVPHKKERITRRGFREYYSQECRREVEKLYDKDIDFLGYDF